MSRLVALGVLAGCSGRVDYVIDTTKLAADPPGAALVVDLVQNGLQVRRDEIALDAARTLVHEDLLVAPSAYAVAAYVDADGDGRCGLSGDLVWRFEFTTTAGGDIRWEVDPDQLRDVRGCYWFEVPDTGSLGGGEAE